MDAREATRIRSFALILAAVYGGFGAIWIALSDWVLAALVTDPVRLTALQTWKGWAFVALSAGLIYVVAARLSRGLHDSEARYRLLFADSPEPLALYDPDTLMMVEINAAACQLFGYDSADARGLAVSDLMSDDTRAHFERERARLTGGARGGGVWRMHRKDGRPLDVATHGQMVTIGGRRLRLVQIVDITARLRAERELLRVVEEQAATTDRMRELAHALSHDLQEPLRQVSSFVQLLAKRYSDQLDSEAHQFIAYAVEGIIRLKALITDVERFAITTAFTPSRVDMFQLANDVVEGLRATALACDADIRVGPLPELRGDPGKLAVVLHALLDNALKFRHPGRAPRIWLDAERDGDCWLFRVVDNGLGVDPEFREAVFSLFSRLHTRERIPGNGSGLALARKLIEAHGGRIWIEDGSDGGITVCFTLPSSAGGADLPAGPGETAA